MKPHELRKNEASTVEIDGVAYRTEIGQPMLPMLVASASSSIARLKDASIGTEEKIRAVSDAFDALQDAAVLAFGESALCLLPPSRRFDTTRIADMLGVLTDIIAGTEFSDALEANE